MANEVGIVIEPKEGIENSKIADKFNAIAGKLDQFGVKNRNLIERAQALFGDIAEDKIDDLAQAVKEDGFTVRREGIMYALNR